MNSEKTIMIFGGGINQLQLIRESQAIGITNIVLDPQKDPPGKSEADLFYQVAGNDYKTTRAIAIEHKIDGIVTGQMEKPLRLMARLAKELGLIFNTPEVTERCIDKWLMKEAFVSQKVPCAKGILIKSTEKLNSRKIEKLFFPLIIKPRDSFSSRGVFRTETIVELKTYLNESRHFASQGDVIVEEFLEGKEYSVEAITFKGNTTIVQFTEKFITPYPNTVEMAHLQPTGLTELERAEISKLVTNGIKALGINNSASHTEVMVTREGPKIIEIGARLGGDFISSYLTKASTGISMDRAAILIALGIKPKLQIKNNRFSLIKYLELPAGRKVLNVSPIHKLANSPKLIYADIFIKPGDIVTKITHSALRPGCVIVEGDSKETVFKYANKYLNLLKNNIILSKDNIIN